MGYYLDHEKLDVYQYAIRFIVLADEINGKLPRGRSYLSDQLKRAASSIALNIAEGAGEFSRSEKVRFYRIAKRSATECSSVLDILSHLQLIERPLFQSSREVLIRTIAMLITMIKKMEATDLNPKQGREGQAQAQAQAQVNQRQTAKRI